MLEELLKMTIDERILEVNLGEASLTHNKVANLMGGFDLACHLLEW